MHLESILSLVVLFVTIYFVIQYDKQHKDKWIPAAVGSLLLVLINFLIGGQDDLLFWLNVLTKASLPAGFVLFACLLGEYMQQGKGFEMFRKLSKSLMWMTVIAFVLSFFVDNTAATAIILNISSVAGGKAAYGTLVAFAALAGGISSVIGDVTSNMLWVTGRVTPQGLIQLLPASIVAAATYYLMVKKDIELSFDEPDDLMLSNNSSIMNYLVLVLGLLLFLLAPAVEVWNHHHITHGSMGQVIMIPFTSIPMPPTLTVGVAAVVGYLLFSALKRKWFYVRPYHPDKPTEAERWHEWNAIWKTALYIFAILVGIESMEHTFHVIGESVKQYNIWGIGYIFGVGSGWVDNIPLMGVLIQVFEFAVDASQWLVIAYLLGIGGVGTPIGSTSSLLAAEQLDISFSSWMQYFWKMWIAVTVGAAFFGIQMLLF